MRMSYWSSSKLADWIRGTKEPLALSWDEWDEWTEKAKADHPCRFWIADELLNWIQNVIYWPVDTWRAVDCYINNRFIDKTHYLRTGLPPGNWYDFDTRLMHGMFESLVDYVEGEAAHMQFGWKGKGKCPHRSREWGLARLEWEAAIVYDESCGVQKDDPQYGKPMPQAEKAIETRALYEWWKDKRPARSDPIDLIDESKEEYQEKYGAMDASEQQHEDEDDEMMCRLVKLRHSLWT